METDSQNNTASEGATTVSELNIHAALRDRFEADAILGARVVPLRARKTATSAQKTARPSDRPVAQTVQQARPYAVPARSGATAIRTGPQSPLPNAGRGVQSIASDADKADRERRLTVLDTSEVKPCTRCGLHATRTNTVFGVGSPAARIMFVGEGPGADEDATGVPFVGRAGELLTRMIENGMGLARDEVYICNVVKCRPPNNRTPAPDEIMMCKDFLLRQIDIICPEVIVALGAPAAQTLLNTREGITRLRGRWHDFYPSGTALIGASIPLMPTFHPAYLLRVPGEKLKAWEDLKLVMARLEIPIHGQK